jgi:hypothetical protein
MTYGIKRFRLALGYAALDSHPLESAAFSRRTNKADIDSLPNRNL